MTGEPIRWQASALPALADFIVSPGFAGATALLAAVIIMCAVLYRSRRDGRRAAGEREQREHHHQEARKDEQHAAAVTRCWDRLVWVVQTAGIEPAASEGATLGLGPELALELLRGLARDAEQLGDDTLASAVTVYQNQFALVLAQQGGPLSDLAAARSPSPDGDPATPQPSSSRETPATAAAGTADETSTGTADLADGARRHRR